MLPRKVAAWAQSPDRAEGARAFWLLCAGIVLLLAAALTGLLEPLSSIFRHVPKDYNEGWNAFWSAVAWDGGRLYPPPEAAISNNYPPLSFYVVGALGHLIGDDIFAGRLLASVSLATIAANIFLWLRVGGSSRGIALFAAALFLAEFEHYAPTYVGVNDPQLFAHALILTGNTLLWRSGFSTRGLIGACGLMILGGMTKHLLVPLPLATTAWIAIYRRDKLPLWIVASIALLGAAALVVKMAYGDAFFENLAAGRVYSSRLVSNAAHRLIDGARPLLLVSLTASLAARRGTPPALGRQATFAIAYWLLAALIGALASGGSGVDRNCYFDLLIAASLCAGVGVECVMRRTLRTPASGTWMPLAPAAALIVFACGIVAGYQSAVRAPAQWSRWQETPAREAAALADIAMIKSLGHGHAACETLALCYWAKMPLAVDFFSFGQKLAVHAVPSSSCERVFVGQPMDVVQVVPVEGASSLTALLPAYCSEVIRNHFRTVAESPYGVVMMRGRPAP